MPGGTYCYITAPSREPHIFYFEGTYDEAFKNFLKKSCAPVAWERDPRRWRVPKKYLGRVISESQRYFDVVYSATDGDYETVGGLDYLTGGEGALNGK